MNSTLSLDLAEQIRDAVENAGASIYEDYSGRGMYSRKCFGITIDRHSGKGIMEIMMELTMEIFDCDHDMLKDEMRDLNWKMVQDSMGTGTIYYFPRIQWPEEESNEKDEDEEDE